MTAIERCEALAALHAHGSSAAVALEGLALHGKSAAAMSAAATAAHEGNGAAATTASVTSATCESGCLAAASGVATATTLLDNSRGLAALIAAMATTGLRYSRS
jgi:hypothetical protein